ncbi:protein PLASTID MOVEMENT IMPAIRED 1-like [Vigna umbellata]|uniref:protein PLASTID MOVEMENT IMPAIRED 1-like n=1 Tax=Vigna umbellata TaxID=87088 RepID=UPI001F5FF205|nr:protein PLASTID MOVEMENT IMPAIRED 1-like [Vigna umbellata]
MADDNSTKRNSSVQLLEELEALSESLYQSSNTARRTASLALPRASPPLVSSAEDDNDTAKIDSKQSNKTRSRRMSLSIWRSKPKPEDAKATPTQPEAKKFSDTENSGEKKGIWSWKPMRAISHIGMHKLSCLFSVEVVTAQGLPSSMNGLRLSVCVRKKETKDGSVQAMPSRVDQGAADFEETLFIRCHVYCNHGSGKQLKFEPRPFWIYLVAVDAKELGFGKNFVDLSQLIQESIEKSQQGTRVRQWDTSFGLSGKAKGGELVLKLGFQIMEKDGGVQIYNPEENFKSSRFKNLTSFARRRSNSSFSLPSPRITSRRDAWTPSQRMLAEDIQGVDDFNLDDPLFHDAPPSTEKLDGGKEMVEDFDLPDFEIVDKGVEVQEKKTYEGEGSEKSIKVKSATSEVVKEIVHDQLRQTRLTELESIAKQIKDLVSMMGEDNKNSTKGDETESLRLDSDEETVTKEFLHMLEDENIRGFKTNQSEKTPSEVTELESEVYLPDLGKGLGCVVQTRDGGYLTSMNPLDKVVARKETPKLAMQMSKPYVLPSNQSLNGLELFQKLAGIGLDELSSQVFSMMPLDELIGKTAEQIAFEGIASAIIQGRNKEGASSSAARIVSALKGMANAMSSGRQERISTGLWNVDETPLTAEQILAFTMQMIEFMVVEGLKIQADMAEKEAPCDASPLWTMEGNKDKDLLGSAVSLEDWIKDQSYTSSGRSSDGEPSNITLMFVVQLRDPIRRFEAVGGPVMVLIHAAGEDTRGSDYHPDDEEKRFKVTSMHVGGLKVRSATKNNSEWDSEKQRLTAMHWLIENGLGKAKKKGKHALVKEQGFLWSISSSIVADMWLRTMRNPDVDLFMKE